MDLFGPVKKADLISGVSIQHKIAELERELRQRRKVYAYRIVNNKMTKEQSDRQLMIMCAILNDYYRQAGVSEDASRFW